MNWRAVVGLGLVALIGCAHGESTDSSPERPAQVGTSGDPLPALMADDPECHLFSHASTVPPFPFFAEKWND